MNFLYLRSSRLHLFKFVPWFMHWQLGGERKVEKSCITSLEPIPRVKGELVHFFCIFWLVGGVVCCTKSAWLVLWTGLTGFGGTGLSTHLGGVVHMCRGDAVCFGGLCYLLEHGFVSDVSSCCPCLRGPRLVFFKWSCSLPFFGFRLLVGVSLYSFLFFFLFSLIIKCVCCQCTHQGGD
jgi:hypothetical protein